MPESFKVLRFIAIALKAYAFAVLLLMAAGLVGIIMGRSALPGPLPQILLDFLFKGSLTFLLLYAFADLIRLLLSVKADLDKKS